MKTRPKKKARLWLPLAVAAGVVAVLLALVPVLAPAVGKWFTAQESEVRDGWAVDVGDLIGVVEAEQVEIRTAPVEASITVLQLIPTDIEAEGFTYYDTGVQQRLRRTLDLGQAIPDGRVEWTAETPLAVLDPFGTGANGLYLYFETDLPTRVEYAVHVEDERIPDFTATAADASGQAYTTSHELQLIGLVPGEVNEVTLKLRGSWGNVRQTVRFTIEMPETHSGYDTLLDHTDGESGEALDDGLFTMMRTNGYLGYGFLYDNAGVMRYEMVLEGFGLDRILFYDKAAGDEIVTCVSSNKLARMNGLGEVLQVYPLGDYELHHDIDYGPDGKVVALAEKAGDANVEDIVLEVDLATGEVTELLDFKKLMAGYYEQTRPIGPTDPFFWQAGEQDWIHLNTIQYLPDSDSLVVSSRETSTVIKAENVHGEASVGWLCGDPAFWQGTGYEGYCLAPVGDFTWQYGQHSVAWAPDPDEEGVGYLRMFNNNYWALSSRDDYQPDLPDTVGTDLYGDGGGADRSYVYVYRVDEKAGTVELTEAFPVPYSSIVSNATRSDATGHWAVNSGIAMVFGEYDGAGRLIRQYSYECTMQGYRTFKYDYKGFWFQ